MVVHLPRALVLPHLSISNSNHVCHLAQQSKLIASLSVSSGTNITVYNVDSSLGSNTALSGSHTGFLFLISLFCCFKGNLYQMSSLSYDTAGTINSAVWWMWKSQHLLSSSLPDPYVFVMRWSSAFTVSCHDWTNFNWKILYCWMVLFIVVCIALKRSFVRAKMAYTWKSMVFYFVEAGTWNDCPSCVSVRFLRIWSANIEIMVMLCGFCWWESEVKSQWVLTRLFRPSSLCLSVCLSGVVWLFSQLYTYNPSEGTRDRLCLLQRVVLFSHCTSENCRFLGHWWRMAVRTSLN